MVGAPQGEASWSGGFWVDPACPGVFVLDFKEQASASLPCYTKGTRVLISLWDSLMFGRVPDRHITGGHSHGVFVLDFKEQASAASPSSLSNLRLLLPRSLFIFPRPFRMISLPSKPTGQAGQQLGWPRTCVAPIGKSG